MAHLSREVRSQCNESLHKLGLSLHDKIPLNELFEILKSAGLVPLMEDRTYWQGMLVGKSGRAYLEMGWFGSSDDEGVYHDVIANSNLVIMWHRFETGNYELVSYLS